jgi:diphosphomevalonate decarboxylase
MTCTAIAHPNIALVKYWGKRDDVLNLPSVGSVSVTLAGLSTRTTVQFTEHAPDDVLHVNGVFRPEAMPRVRAVLDRIRAQAPQYAHCKADIVSFNDFPTAAGLASSASGFAALATAASHAAGIVLGARELSVLARIGSGSAARSVWGGFVEMLKGEAADGSDAYAQPLFEPSHWPLEGFVAVTQETPKETASTQGMAHSKGLSAFYEGWVRSAPADIVCVKKALQERDFEALAAVAEHSCLKMHGLMMSSQPPLLYFTPATLAVIQAVREMRKKGVAAFFTVDAGPQVKVLCAPGHADAALKVVRHIPGVLRTVPVSLGEGVQVVHA